MAIRVHHILARIPLFLRVVSLHVLVVGAWWAFGAALTPTAQPAAPVQAQVAPVPAPAAPVAETIISGQPASLVLPRIGLAHDIIPGTYDYDTKQWTLTDDKAQYATMTPELNTKTGQTLIYGHNTVVMFEPLKNVQAGDELRITATNGRVFVYTYTHDAVVAPTDTTVLTETSAEPRVVLMTCEGWLSETRRLLYFTYKEVV